MILTTTINPGLAIHVPMLQPEERVDFILKNL